MSFARLLRESTEALVAAGSRTARLLRGSTEILVGAGQRAARLLRGSTEVLIGAGQRPGRMERESAEVLVGAGQRPGRLLRISVEAIFIKGVGIYKSTDAMETVRMLRPATGFAAWPLLAKGKDIAVGPVALYNDWPTVVQSPIGGSATYPRRTARLEVSWVLKQDPVAASQFPLDSLKRLGNNLYRIATSDGNSPTYGPHVGQLQRSTDEGVTWANIGPAPNLSNGYWWGVQDVEIAPGGVLWLAATGAVPSAEAGHAPAVYKSIDDGANWTLVYQDTSQAGTPLQWRRFLDIMTHLASSAIIAIIGDRANGIANTWVTQNGADFTRNEGSAGQSVEGLRHGVLLHVPTNRIVAIRRITAIYTDDFGATQWTEGPVIFSTYSYQIIDIGADVLLASGGSALNPVLVRSMDRGLSWLTILDSTDVPAAVNTFAGLTYDRLAGSGGVLYISTLEEGASARVFALDKPGICPAHYPLRDISLGLDGKFTGSNDAIAARGIARRA